MSLPAPAPARARVRPATLADAPTIGRLGAVLVQVHHDFDARRFIAATLQTAQGYGAYVGAQIGQPDVVVLVAEHDGDVSGYAWGSVEGIDYMSLRGPAGVIYDIVVAPEERGQGIGQSLLSATISALEVLGAPRVVLSTASRNEAAQRLFRRNGFRDTMIEMTRERNGDAA